MSKGNFKQRLSRKFKREEIDLPDEKDLKKDLEIDDHIISLDELCERHTTDPINGLHSMVAEERLRINGPNCLELPKGKSSWAILAAYMFGGFSMLLWLGAFLSFVGFVVTYLKTYEMEEEHLYLAGLLITINLVTGFFGFYQESANASVMLGFQRMMPKAARVIRDGQLHEIPCEELVLGDLVFVEAGSCVPADIRIITSNVLKVDNSSITGESEPQLRTPAATDKNPLETSNLAFYSTNVVEGSGYGIIVACGKATLMGHIAGLASTLVAQITPIQREINFFIKIITCLALLAGGLCFVLALTLGYDIFMAFVFCISIIVANVPEGLMVTLTASLTLTAKRMARKNCLVKNLQAIETLGSTSVICSDKTGTLTQNRMTVSHFYYDDKIVDVLDEDYAFEDSVALLRLCRVGILCSKATYHNEDLDYPIEERRIIGDASESGVFKCMDGLFQNVLDQREVSPKVAEIPFNSTNKYQVSIHDTFQGYVVVMKGAPERILSRCSTIVIQGQNVDIGPYRARVDKAMLDIGYMGERVLAFADYELPLQQYPRSYKFDTQKQNFPLEGLRFCGLMSLIDPPKLGVHEAVLKCRTAGVKVVMLTGDHPVTATAIAKKVGIIGPDSVTVYDIAMQRGIPLTALKPEDRERCNAIVVAGPELREMEDYQIDEIIQTYKEIVFARTSPQQKLQIVEAFQRNNFIVAVTGDGVNDSPALKKANIGISMGISGSEVSKEAADMILLDDNFATIVTGIEEGRLIFDNLKKTIGYLLTSNIPEISPFLMYVFISIPQALSVMAIMVIDVGTDLWPAISLAYEKPEADIMRHAPRDPNKDTLVNLKLILFTYVQIGVVQACASFSCYFYIMESYGFCLDRLLGIRVEWEDKYNNAVTDCYGQEWTYFERRVLERKGYSAYFMSFVLTQVADVIICKTRRLSIFRQGMSNWVLNLGCIFEMGLAAFVVFCPYVNHALRFEPIVLDCLLPVIPYCLFIIIYDEIRRLIIRRRPGGWIERETYF
ncbi:sodium/potassium-transporting ATPase subunit alpha-like [Onthophagus taurus]|uniref:sodium/potassium-transporting ATPase subunit alpha-like n=1 Tax=Onthophagus taurus TaxID=166361 RepID=UPI000C205F75|nr:sodium/potassium-transporting ATPase subunit alpha-like [Onthophagus taurus]